MDFDIFHWLGVIWVGSIVGRLLITWYAIHTGKFVPGKSDKEEPKTPETTLTTVETIFYANSTEKRIKAILILENRTKQFLACGPTIEQALANLEINQPGKKFLIVDEIESAE